MSKFIDSGDGLKVKHPPKSKTAVHAGRRLRQQQTTAGDVQQLTQIGAAKRLLAYDRTWITQVQQKQNQSPEPPKSDRVRPETFNGSPQAIAQELKRVHKALAPATSALNYYFNKQRRPLGNDDQMKHDKAGEELRKLFNADKPDPAKVKTKPKEKPDPVGVNPVGSNPVGG